MSEKIGIAYTDINVLLSRVMLSGVIITERDDYVLGAIVSDGKLRRPSREELTPFLATDETPDAGLVEIIGPTQKLVDEIRGYPGPFFKPATAGPNQLTVTRDEELFHGMHYDNNYGKLIGNRLESPRTLAYNMGPQGRWLMLGSVDAYDLARLYADGDPAYMPTTTDLRRYVRDETQPPMQCLYIYNAKGEGYELPAEAAAHDASRIGLPGEATAGYMVGTWQPGYFGSVV